MSTGEIWQYDASYCLICSILSRKYSQRLRCYFINRSISQSGNCWDDTRVERLFRRLNFEWQLPSLDHRSASEQDSS